ncbi:MAG: diaminopimelate decarboxylase [Firmicutes bacterium]|nr:diaminopimelate decarboxylase [Bacillota bacterium]
MKPQPQLICDNLSISAEGRLLFAGQDTVLLAETYGTPLYLLDEDQLRANCRMYRRAMAANFAACEVLYAAKANMFSGICRIIEEEGVCLDVVSSGELYTALHAAFPPARIYMNGNNKTDDDLRYAIGSRIGGIVVDSTEELLAAERIAAELGVEQPILLRLTPGIDPHTYAAVATGQVDSKFGVPMETGQAAELVRLALAQPHLPLIGYHCHVGSMVFDEDVFERSAEVMLDFMLAMRDELGFVPRILDLGGGYGVRYVASDAAIDIEARIGELAAFIKAHCQQIGLDVPEIHLEPGRSLVANAGLTLYTVGAVKTVPGFRTYVSVDGGMTDNPRYALYGSSYTCLLANKAAEEASLTCDLVGRCCESGDVVQPSVALPQSVCRGDIAAVCITGAYNYSMASNYNRLPRPPIVMLRDGESYVAVERESFADLCRLDK